MDNIAYINGALIRLFILLQGVFEKQYIAEEERVLGCSSEMIECLSYIVLQI